MNPESNQTIVIRDLSNAEFLARYAAPGRVGLSGGETLVDQAIRRAERHLHPEAQWGLWSHAFVFQGLRVDGHHWLIESDLQFHHKHLRLGVQENRVSKYHNEGYYTALAVLDFGLNDDQVNQLLHEGLELVATRTEYSVTELLGTLIALRLAKLRSQENLLARDRSLFCSAFVQHLFRKAGVDLTPGVAIKNTTPEDLSRCELPHTTWLLVRQAAPSALAKATAKVKRRVGARLRYVRRKVASR
jgi:hypothetical protein